MASVALQAQTAKDRRLDYLLLGGAALVGLGVLWLASDDEEDVLAARFPDLWELQDPNALRVAGQRGLVYPYEIAAFATNGRTPVVQRMVTWLEEAKGLVNDREELVLAACMRPTYAELVYFTELFVQRWGLSPGAWISTFMTPGSDASTLSAIVAHVERLRQVNATSHR